MDPLVSKFLGLAIRGKHTHIVWSGGPDKDCPTRHVEQKGWPSQKHPSILTRKIMDKSFSWGVQQTFIYNWRLQRCYTDYPSSRLCNMKYHRRYITQSILIISKVADSLFTSFWRSIIGKIWGAGEGVPKNSLVPWLWFKVLVGKESWTWGVSCVAIESSPPLNNFLCLCLCGSLSNILWSLVV